VKTHYIEGDLEPSKTCAVCAHWLPISRQCAAFPERIPDAIWLGENPHTAPYPGDNGIQFEDARKPALAEAS
jgi:hypothetical protein